MNDLVDHLIYLTKNKEEYLKYFEWTKHYQRRAPNQLQQAICQVTFSICHKSDIYFQSCKMLYNHERQSFYTNVSQWYSPDNFCDNNYAHRLFQKLTGKTLPKQTAKFIAG
jgi:hypothetical protein